MGLVGKISLSLRNDLKQFKNNGLSYQFVSIWVYIWLFSVFVSICCLFLIYSELYLNFTGFNPENVRYTLSAFIQSLAAIITLTVSLSIIAAQLMSSSYSIRIIEIYRKNPDLWVILGIYLVVIILDVYVLLFFNYNYLVINNDNLLFGFSSENWVGFCFLLSIFALLSLIPYLYNTISILRPKKIINILGKDLKSFKKDYDKNSTLQILNDLLISGISKSDSSLISLVLDETDWIFYRLVKDISDSEKDNSQKADEIYQLTKDYSYFIEDVENYAFNKKMEYAIYRFILSIDYLFKKTVPYSYIDRDKINLIFTSLFILAQKSMILEFRGAVNIYNIILKEQLKALNTPDRLESLKDCIITSIGIYIYYKPEHPHYHLTNFLEIYESEIDTLLKEKNYEIIKYIISRFYNLFAFYIKNGYSDSVSIIIQFYNSVIEKCDDKAYNPIVNEVILICFTCAFCLSPDNSIKNIFLNQLEYLKSTREELFDKGLIVFKENLKDVPDLLESVKQIYPDK